MLTIFFTSAATYSGCNKIERSDNLLFSKYNAPLEFPRFEKVILSKGDTRDPLGIYIAFRGKEFSIDALLSNKGLKQ